MDGILILDKPKGMTSHDCVNKARRAFNTRKVGHSGTLDPEASGVLVLAINRATRILEFLNQDDKAYLFSVLFNRTTDTLDHTGEVTQEILHAPLDGLDDVTQTFIGTYDQSPPAYSAVKVKGKKLYEYAREGKPIPHVPKRRITVHALSRISEVKSEGGVHETAFEVHASKGLYVRKLASDIAKALGTVAHTTSIRRLQAGLFTLERSVTLETLQEGTAELLTMNEALAHIPQVCVDDETEKALKDGKKVALKTDAPTVRLVKGDTLLALYEKETDGIYRARKVLAQGGAS